MVVDAGSYRGKLAAQEFLGCLGGRIDVAVDEQTPV
jgi:hypothetical protein